MDFWLEIRRVPDDPETLRKAVTEAEWADAARMNPASRRTEWLAWRAIVREHLGRDITITYSQTGAPILGSPAAEGCPQDGVAAHPAGMNSSVENPPCHPDDASRTGCDPQLGPVFFGSPPAEGWREATGWSGQGYISVSHTRGWVAVLWSPEPCAVDIELKTRKISPATLARIGAVMPALPAVIQNRNELEREESTAHIAAWCAREAIYKYKSATGTCKSDGSEPAPTTPEATPAIPEVRFHHHPEFIVAVIAK